MEVNGSDFCDKFFFNLLKEHLIKLKLIYITFQFDGKFYSRTCSGVDLLSGMHTKRCQLLHLLSRTVNEVNNWVKVPLAERLSNNGGQTIERSRRAMHFRGIRGGSTGSLLCNAIPRLRRRKRKTKKNHSDLSRTNFEKSDLEFRHLQSYSIEGQSVLYCRQVCLCH